MHRRNRGYPRMPEFDHDTGNHSVADLAGHQWRARLGALPHVGYAAGAMRSKWLTYAALVAVNGLTSDAQR